MRILGVPEPTNTGRMEEYVEKFLITLSKVLVVTRAHRSLGTRPPPGSPSRPIVAKLLNYRDRDAVLRLARESGSITYEGNSIYSDFTLQVQETRCKFHC